jgi:hypothetical protein
MLHLQEILALREGERIMRIQRRSIWTAVPGLLLAAFLIALPFFFLFPLIGFGSLGIAIICLGLAIGIYLALKQVLLWDANTLVLTDQRLIAVRQGGLWSRQVIEAPLAGIRVEVKRSLYGYLSRTGDIEIYGHGLSDPVVMETVPGSESIARMIAGLRDSQNAGFTLKEVESESSRFEI